jgi:hypothetical protein
MSSGRSGTTAKARAVEPHCGRQAKKVVVGGWLTGFHRARTMSPGLLVGCSEV